MRTLTDVFTPGAPTLPEGLRTLAVSPERELEPGMTVRAAFTFRNEGGACATGVRVRFNVPPGLVYLVGSARLDGADLDDEHGNSPLISRAGAEIGEVAPWQERRIEMAYSVAGAIENGTTVEIQAAVAASEVEPVGSNLVRLVVRSRPALQNALTDVRIEPSENQAVPGAEAIVTVRVHNAGDSSAHDLSIDAPIPEHTSYVAGSARLDGRGLARDLPAPVLVPVLAAGATLTLQFCVRIDSPLPDAAAIVARARIGAQEIAAFAPEAAAITVRSAPNFEDDRSVLTIEPAGEAAAGARVTLRLRLWNAGTCATQSAAVRLTLPDGLIPVRGGVRIDGHALRERKNGASYDLGAIPAGACVDFAADAMLAAPIEDGTALPVRALLQYDGCERAFECVVTVRSKPFFPARRNRVERSGAVALRPGEECEALVAIANDGSAAATDAVLGVQADPAFDDVRVYEKNAKLELQNGAVDIGTIEPNAKRSLTIRARLRTPQADREAVRLTASLHTQELGELPLGTAEWRTDSHAAFSDRTSMLTLAQDRMLRPHDVTDVHVRLRNDGTDAARDVCLRLLFSPELALESADGATREGPVLRFGEIAAGGAAQARLGVALLRGPAKGHPVTLEAVLSAQGMLPVQLSPLVLHAVSEPDFSGGTLHVHPEAPVEPGESMAFTLQLRNGGDGAAAQMRVSADPLDALIYVPNSTTVNGVPVRDAGMRSALTSERGLVMSGVEPGVEIAIGWREVANNAIASSEAVTRIVRVAYGDDRVDEIRSREIVVRRAPSFANSVSGLPFALDGMLGPAAEPPQAALESVEFVELPPAKPVLALASPERLDGALHFLQETRFPGLIAHLFAVRAFMPDTASAPLRESLREVLERLFIKLRVPNYAVASRDLETPALRQAVEAALRDPAAQTLDIERDLQAAAAAFAVSEAGTAPLWAILARLIPPAGEALAHYRALLVEALDELAAADANAFAGALQHRAYPVLDAALDVVRAQFGARV